MDEAKQMAAIRVIVRLFGAQGPRMTSDPNLHIFKNKTNRRPRVSNKHALFGSTTWYTWLLGLMKGSELLRGELWEYMYSMGTALHQN